MWLHFFAFLIFFQCSFSLEVNEINSAQPELNLDYQRLLAAIDKRYGNWFIQKIDHFVPIFKTSSWKQKHWKVDTFAKPDGPHFLFLGGESPSSVNEIVSDDLPMVQWAKKVGATLWLLEHRFYGESRPFENQTDENLKYLSSQQALADVANFIRSQNMRLVNPKWIVFGGSYSGALALWFRQKYPELVIGAIGSSATISLTLEYHSYFQNVEDAIRTHNSECTSNIKDAFDELQSKLATFGGKNEINSLFQNDLSPSSSLTSFESGEFYFYHLMVTIAKMVQQNNPTDDDQGIDKLCKIMNIKSTNKVFNLAIMKSQISPGNINILKTAFGGENVTSAFKFTGYEIPSLATGRAWLWQVCNELVAFTTVANESSIFGNIVPLNFFINQCQVIFGEKYNLDYFINVTSKVTQEYGGTENYKGTNVVSTWGTIDPWKDLCLKKSKHPSVVTVKIEGESHCSDLGASTDGDSDSLKNARKIILENIQKWIKEANRKVLWHPRNLKHV